MDEPLFMKGGASEWSIFKRDVQKCLELFSKEKLRFRIGLKNQNVRKVQWETCCEYITASAAHFFEWLRALKNSEIAINSSENPFSRLDSSHWAYLDYQHMFDLFEENYEMIRDVNWKSFGLDRDGWQSTFWMGSQGAYTPCHYDSYGYNLVVQVRGRKLWILFPTDASTAIMNPTRLPYEESSVFANLDLFSVPRGFVEETKPRLIILEPGDLLYVPRHWWHFAQCLDDPSISVNTWIDVSADKHERVKEAITRCMITLMKDKLRDHLLDTDFNLERSIDLLNLAMTSESDQSEELDGHGGDQFLLEFYRNYKEKLECVPIANVQQFCNYMGQRPTTTTNSAGNSGNANSAVNLEDLLSALFDRKSIATIERLLIDRRNLKLNTLS